MSGTIHKTVIIVGGGFAGSVFALKFARQNPSVDVVVIEKDRKPGLGLAYGACDGQHLLNVPVHRMELGLTPSFQDWVAASGESLADALAESGGALADAFVPRALFGSYLSEHLTAAASYGKSRGLRFVRGEAVRLLDFPLRGVQLSDGRKFEADLVVLATGNLAPRPPDTRSDWIYDTPLFVSDPWAEGAFDELDQAAPVVLLGSGLTMVDIALRLTGRGHHGPIYVISRHGLMPTTHCAGAAWETFINPDVHFAPRQLSRLIRAEAARAKRQGVPWQRVIDAVRPAVARVWHSWSHPERSQFLRHLRARWDVHRHRMAPRVASRVRGLVDGGQLRLIGGRVSAYEIRGERVRVSVAKRSSRETIALDAALIVNCTGPRSDFNEIAIPLFADLKRRGLMAPDKLKLGIETENCAVVSPAGHVSPWLYALGPLTRPAWWEVTAVPEINAQIDHLVRDLSKGAEEPSARAPLLADAFLELGSGI